MAEQIGAQAALVLAGGALGWLGNWLLQFRRDKRDATTQALGALQTALEQQREEIDRLAERMTAATNAEDRCIRRLRLLQEDVHALRHALTRAGVAVPHLPSESAAPVGAD